jgi:hypothetical protein
MVPNPPLVQSWHGRTRPGRPSLVTAVLPQELRYYRSFSYVLATNVVACKAPPAGKLPRYEALLALGGCSVCRLLTGGSTVRTLLAELTTTPSAETTSVYPGTSRVRLPNDPFWGRVPQNSPRNRPVPPPQQPVRPRPARLARPVRDRPAGPPLGAVRLARVPRGQGPSGTRTRRRPDPHARRTHRSHGRRVVPRLHATRHYADPDDGESSEVREVKRSARPVPGVQPVPGPGGAVRRPAGGPQEQGAALAGRSPEA